MIRSLLKKVARRVLHRESAPAPAARQRTMQPIPAPPPAGSKANAPVEEEPRVEIEGPEISTRMIDGETFYFVDIREPRELAAGYVKGAHLIPMNQVPQRLNELPTDTTLVVYCAAGARSFGVTHYLREHGFERSWSLVGGIHGWLEHGGELAQPPPSARFPLTTAVRITRSPLTVDGVTIPPELAAGTVQAIEAREASAIYTVGLVDADGQLVAVTGLAEDELTRP